MSTLYDIMNISVKVCIVMAAMISTKICDGSEIGSPSFLEVHNNHKIPEELFPIIMQPKFNQFDLSSSWSNHNKNKWKSYLGYVLRSDVGKRGILPYLVIYPMMHFIFSY